LVFVCTRPLTSESAMCCSVLAIRDVQKTEILFVFGFKNRTVQKLDICSDGFPIENYMQSAIQIKVNENNFTRVKCACKERFKIRLKQS